MNKTLIECNQIGSKELGKPLKGGELKDFTIIFATESVPSTYTEMELTAWVNT